MSNSLPTSAISVDFKKTRIRIYKQTLALLGKPEYVQLLVNPAEMTLIILAVDQRTPEAHKVCLSDIHPEDSVELYSKSLINELGTLAVNPDVKYTYKIIGTKLPNIPAVLFSMKTMQKVLNE